MHPTASPRHPFKALVALVAMATFVHGLFEHVGPRHGTGQRIEIVTQSQSQSQSQSHAACASLEPALDCDDEDDPDMPDSIFVETDDAEDV
jgi:hypothetical protein